MSDYAQQFLKELLDDLENDRLVLPTLPEVALKVRDVVDDENAGVADLTKVIATDAALSARLIQVANSPLMRANRSIDTLEGAVNRLGIKLIRELAISMVMQQMFQATSDLTDKKLRALWEHSTEVAAIAHVLAAQFTNLQPEQAMLAGLVHDIGALPILKKAEDYPELLEDEAALDMILRKLHPRIGATILASWNFPRELVQVASEHENLQRHTPELDYVDVVMVANLQSHADSDHPLASADCNSIEAFTKLGLSPEIQVVDMEETAEDIREAQRLLNS